MAQYNNPYLSNYSLYNPYGQYGNFQQFQQTPQQNQQPYSNGSNGLIYVHGLEGAHAYVMPTGVDRVILWDDTDDRFYIKGYDDMGKPKIIADNDFFPHVESKGIKSELTDSTGYVTMDYLDKVLGKLKIGDNGRIVRIDEHDA